MGLLGLLRKAGRIWLGASATENAMKQGKAVLLLLASDASAPTTRRAVRLAGEAGVQYITLPYGKETFGRAVGRRECALAAIADKGVADTILKNMIRT